MIIDDEIRIESFFWVIEVTRDTIILHNILAQGKATTFLLYLLAQSSVWSYLLMMSVMRMMKRSLHWREQWVPF